MAAAELSGKSDMAAVVVIAAVGVGVGVGVGGGGGGGVRVGVGVGVGVVDGASAAAVKSGATRFHIRSHGPPAK